MHKIGSKENKDYTIVLKMLINPISKISNFMIPIIINSCWKIVNAKNLNTILFLTLEREEIQIRLYQEAFGCNITVCITWKRHQNCFLVKVHENHNV